MKMTEEEGLVLMLVGLALGFFAGVLWAPRSGRETRRDLRRVSKDNLDYLVEEAERVRNGTDRLVDSAKKWLARPRTSGRAVKTNVEPGAEDLAQ
jgi:gas vesicle protein